MGMLCFYCFHGNPSSTHPNTSGLDVMRMGVGLRRGCGWGWGAEGQRSDFQYGLNCFSRNLLCTKTKTL